MNEYKITCCAPGTDISIIHVIERTEAAATKAFRANLKESHGSVAPDILNIELFNDNDCATKQQERDTLAAIKKMFAELGPQSRRLPAFAGCFADAEQNIENDEAYSMKGRLEWTEEKLAAAQAKVKQMEAAHAGDHRQTPTGE